MLNKSPTIQKEENCLPFYMNCIPELFQKKCEEELNETPERKKQCIQELRNALKNDKVTKDVDFLEDFLVQYLRHSKYNTDKAFNLLRNLTIFRTKDPKYFESIPDEYFSTKASTKYGIILPKRCPDGSTVVLAHLGKWDPDEFEFEDFKRSILFTFLQLLRDPMSQINGFKFIYDFSGTGLQHIKYCTPKNLYLIYYLSLYCIPGRYKEIHFINENRVLRLSWMVIKGFLPDKIKKRVFFHSHTKELLNFFPKSVLPEQYGGELVDIYATNFMQRANKEQKKNTIEGQPNFY